MPELIHHNDGDECPAQLHDFVSLVEDDRSIGIVCVICGKVVYENRSASSFIVTANGLELRSDGQAYKRKDPRF